jgi:hypothetical protein
MVVLSSLKVTATEVAAVQAELVLEVDEDVVLVEVDVVFDVVAAAVEDVVPGMVVSCQCI